MTYQTDFLPYSLGTLLYTPAVNQTIAQKIQSGVFRDLNALVLCLEDSIGDDEVQDAERVLQSTLRQLALQKENRPMIFIRVRNPAQLRTLGEFLAQELPAVAGFVLPKFDETNLEAYFNAFLSVESACAAPKYLLPILESVHIARGLNRFAVLESLKRGMEDMRGKILNIRVGGNDFCGIYGLRRDVHHTIYDLGVVRDILMDILNVFSRDYLISAPVFEYYDNGTDDCWKAGLQKELALDLQNGFIGKTAIHPSQIPVIRDALKPNSKDYADALAILSRGCSSGVAASGVLNRMNEPKTHLKWAERIRILGEIYGVKDAFTGEDREK